MNLDFSDDQKFLQSEARKFLEKEGSLGRNREVLDDKKSLMFLGGGKSGKDPLIFQTNGSPYRGFLDGRINKNQYQLILRLSNMELKK